MSRVVCGALLVAGSKVTSTGGKQNVLSNNTLVLAHCTCACTKSCCAYDMVSVLITGHVHPFLHSCKSSTATDIPESGQRV